MSAMAAPDICTDDQEFRRWLLREADEHGTAVVEVAGDGHNAPFSFSVGAWRRFGIAEAVVIGLPDGMGTTLVNAYVELARAGRRFVPGECCDDFFDGLPVTLERVAKGHYLEYFGSAFLLYRTGDFPAMQLLVPTADGVWPWQPNAPAGFADWQPVLTESGLPESWTPGVDGP
jgi:hypothetical protein